MSYNSGVLVTQVGEEYQIKFNYDAYLISLIKEIGGRRWNPDLKVWSIPKDKLGFFLNKIKGTVYESVTRIISDENLNENATLEPTTTIPDIDISNVPFYVKEGSSPYPHQLDFMKFAIDRELRGKWSGFLCCDEQGLGKTLCTINLALYNKENYGFKHCLVICNVNTSKYNWRQEVIDATNGKMIGYILGSRIKRNGTISCEGGAAKLEDLQNGTMYGDRNGEKLPFFLIINVEGLRTKVGRKYPVTEEIIKYINSGRLQMIAIDEIHKNMSPTSTQGKQILKIKQATGSRVLWLPITGTPITKKPTDLFLPLKLTDVHQYKSFYIWSQNFCVYGGYGGYEVIGYKNIPQLKQMLQDNMIRRLKKDVLDLPPKIYFTEYVENTPYQQKLYAQIQADLIDHAESIVKLGNPLSKLIRLRQANGAPEILDPDIPIDSNYCKKYNAKYSRVFEILEDIHERDEKVIIFSNWVEPLRTLYRLLKKKYPKICTFTGTMNDRDRQKHKEVFMNNPEYWILLGTIGAAGTTHTFTSANNLIFLDEPFNASDKFQAEDRVHRIGTSKSINIHTLISKDTVDERVHNIVYSKAATSKYIVDGEMDFKSNPDLFYKLLGVDAIG